MFATCLMTQSSSENICGNINKPVDSVPYSRIFQEKGMTCKLPPCKMRGNDMPHIYWVFSRVCIHTAYAQVVINASILEQIILALVRVIDQN